MSSVPTQCSWYPPTAPLRVFVSSKMDELRDARAAVQDRLRDLRMLAFVYEMDARASGDTVVQTVSHLIEDADVFVGLFWRECGPVTAMEFDHAKKLGKPRLVFIRDRNLAREGDLEEFLRREVYDLNVGVTYDSFNEVNELCDKVEAAVMNLLFKAYREGSRQVSPGVIPAVARLACDGRLP